MCLYNRLATLSIHTHTHTHWCYSNVIATLLLALRCGGILPGIDGWAILRPSSFPMYWRRKKKKCIILWFSHPSCNLTEASDLSCRKITHNITSSGQNSATCVLHGWMDGGEPATLVMVIHKTTTWQRLGKSTIFQLYLVGMDNAILFFNFESDRTQACQWSKMPFPISELSFPSHLPMTSDSLAQTGVKVWEKRDSAADDVSHMLLGRNVLLCLLPTRHSVGTECKSQFTL